MQACLTFAVRLGVCPQCKSSAQVADLPFLISEACGYACGINLSQSTVTSLTFHLPTCANM